MFKPLFYFYSVVGLFLGLPGFRFCGAGGGTAPPDPAEPDPNDAPRSAAYAACILLNCSLC